MIATLPEEKLRALDEALGWVPEHYQVAPAGDWTYWLFLAGRGAGKTDAGAHYVDSHVNGPACLEGPVPHRVAIAAPTLGDARLTCVKGETGILVHNPAVKFAFTDGELYWPNGGHGRIFGAYTPEDIERWRGPQHCLVWADELAVWRQLDECWTNMRLGLRLGDHPKVVITTTGKPRKLLKSLMARTDTVVTRAKTSDNRNMASNVRAELYDLFAGTRYERQELGGEIVEDITGALVDAKWITDNRQGWPVHFVNGQMVPQMSTIVVGVDPAVTSKEDSDETGIVVVGRGVDGFGYVMEDCSLRGTPDQWASKAVAAYHRWDADRIVAEVNNGGEMVALTIHTVDGNVPVKSVHASQGKRTRAEPISAKYQQGRIRSPETWPKLEEQLTTWVPGSGQDSPDRLDALVWGFTEVLVAGGAWQQASVSSGVA